MSGTLYGHMHSCNFNVYNTTNTFTQCHTHMHGYWYIVSAVVVVGLIIIALMSFLVVIFVAAHRSRGQNNTRTEVSNLLTQNEYNVRYIIGV